MLACFLLFSLIDVYLVGEFGAGEASPLLLLWLTIVPAVFGTIHGLCATLETYQALAARSRVSVGVIVESIVFCACQLLVPLALASGLITFDDPFVVLLAWIAFAIAVRNAIRH